MFTFTDEPFVRARRTLRHLVRVHRDDIAAEHEFMAADRSIAPDVWDAHHEDDGYSCTDGTQTMTRLLEAVSVAYGYPMDRLDDCIFTLDRAEDDFAHPPCPYHERGLECRNARIVGVDGDGEPYSDGGCGCDEREMRAYTLERWNRRRPWRHHQVPHFGGRVICTNTLRT